MADHANNGASKTATLVIAAITQFLSAFTTAVVVALPTIGREFSMNAITLGWVANSTTLAMAIILLPLGRIADIYGRKKVLTCGILLSTVASFLCGMANSAALLILFRVLQGLGAGMTSGTVIAVLTSVFPPKERGKAIGIAVAGVYLGLSLAPFVGGFLTQHVSWRGVFFLTAFFGFIVAVLIFWKLRGEWADARGERFDLAGSIAFSVSLALILYGFSALPAMRGIILIVFGLLGMLAFVRLEGKTESPVLDIGLFRRNALFVFSNLATLISYCAIFAVGFQITLYLQYNKGLTPQTAGLILVTQPVFQVISAPIAGMLSDKTDPRKVAAVGMAMQFAGLLLFAFLTEGTGLGFIIPTLVILGLGLGFFASPNMNAVMGSVEARFFGVASGTQATMRHGGQALSMAIVLMMFAIHMGNVQITPEYYPAFLESIKTSFTIFAILCFGGIFAQLAGRKLR